VVLTSAPGGAVIVAFNALLLRHVRLRWV